MFSGAPRNFFMDPAGELISIVKCGSSFFFFTTLEDANVNGRHGFRIKHSHFSLYFHLYKYKVSRFVKILAMYQQLPLKKYNNLVNP